MRQFFKNRRGATSIEYALIASIIFFAILGSIGPIGTALNGMFGQAEAGLEN
jgi:Flp pilus assembly pilin Flp